MSRVDAYGIGRDEREVISLLRIRLEGKREVHESVPTYTAVGFAHERVERMLAARRFQRS